MLPLRLIRGGTKSNMVNDLKPKYEAPKAIHMSDMVTVMGQQPCSTGDGAAGNCRTGTNPGGNCSNGTGPGVSASCTNGTGALSDCGTGTSPGTSCAPTGNSP